MVAAPPLDRITVAEAVDRYLAGVTRAVRGHSLSSTTAANYTRDLTEFTELAGADTILDDLTAEAIDDIVLEYGAKPDARFAKPKAGPDGHTKTRGEGAQARFRQSVSRLFSEAILEGWVQANPMPRTKVKPKMKGLVAPARKALPASSAAALVDLPRVLEEARKVNGTERPDMRLALRDEFLLRLMVEVGPRVSEISNADMADMETRDDGTTWLRLLGKGNKERHVPLSPDTVAAYQRYVEHERPEPKPRIRKFENDKGMLVAETTATADDAERALVLTWRGRRMKQRDIQLMVARMHARLPAQVRRAVTPHGLRHTAATLLLTSGAADVKTVQSMLGHASIATTGVYLDTVDAALVQAVRQHPVTGDRHVASR